MSLFSPLRNAAKRQYRDRGYCVFRGIFSPTDVDKLAIQACSLLPPYPGTLLRQSGRNEANDFFPGTQLIRNTPLNLHLALTSELRPVWEALRTLIASPALAQRLRELDGATHYHISQSLLFFAAQTTSLHIDSWGVDTVPHGGAHTLWIPLRDLDGRSGVPAVIPWPCGKLVTEADLGLPAEGPQAERYDRYHRALESSLLHSSPDIATALVRRGDLIVWSSLTPHFTLPSQPFPTERLSVQVLLRPSRPSWGNFTVQPTSYPTTHVLPANEHFSYFVPREIHDEFGIGEVWKQ